MRSALTLVTALVALLAVPSSALATCWINDDGETECCGGGMCGDEYLREETPMPLPPEPEEVVFHAAFAAGHGWLFGEMDEVFDASDVGGRIMFGMSYLGIRLDAVIFGTDLISTVAPTISTVSFGGALGYEFVPWKDDGLSIGIVPHVGAAYTILTESVLDSHSGASASVGAEFYFGAELFDGFGIRFIADLTHEWVWLESDQLSRHINGQMLHLTGGFGVTF